MRAYQYKLTPLTPIHIGNGDSLEAYQYVIKDGHLYTFDMSTLYQKISSKHQQLLKDAMLTNAILLRTRVNDLYTEEYGYTSKMKVSRAIEKLYNDKLRGASKQSMQNQLLIQAFINSMNKAYIPGSTIKGAIRSGIVHAIAKEREDVEYTITKNPRINLDKAKTPKWVQQIDNEYFEYNNIPQDPFKTVKISDTVGELSLLVGQTNVWTLKHGRFNSGVPMYLTCASGVLQNADAHTVEGRLVSDDKLLTKMKYQNLSLADIIDDNWTKALHVMESEEEFFERAGYSDGVAIYRKLQKYLRGLDMEMAMPLRMGRGCGMNSTTLNLVNKKRSNRTDPASRMLFEGKYPMGWCVMEFVEL
ncbi:MAG: type III-A CRISPR-associated RAMP protein Csm5 [Epulopiscium sp. Nele67-Bin001]|nr:MAG: type III-A CRISPR-associated RAMP protein Csm5 [Epulopiscium sp. Nele67-Bin001]